MRERFKTIRRLLEKDLEFERNAVKTYNGFSERIGDERFKDMEERRSQHRGDKE